MGTIVKTAELFFFVLSLGLLPYLFFANSALMGIGFFRMVWGISFISFIFTNIFPFIFSYSYFFVALIFLSLFLFYRERSSKIFFPLSHFLLLFGISYSYYLRNLSVLKPSLELINILASAGLLGGTVFGMLLGHWYLVVPKLSMNPLKKVMMGFFFFLGLKVVIAIFANWEILMNPYSLDYFHLMILSMRFLWGHFLCLVLGIFCWKLTKIRSTTSATGLLYVMVFFTLMGEVMGYYLYIEKGLIV